QGEALPSAALTLQGFAEDRRYAFVQATSRSSFPWLTARELPELLYYRTSVEKAGTPEVAVTVATAHGENWPIESDDLRKVLEARNSEVRRSEAWAERGNLCDGPYARRSAGRRPYFA